MSKRVKNKKGKLGRSPKFNKQIYNQEGTMNDLFSPYRKRFRFNGYTDLVRCRGKYIPYRKSAVFNGTQFA